MRLTLKISLFLNFVLLVGICCICETWLNSGSRRVRSSNIKNPQAASGPAQNENIGASRDDASHEAFQWNQLESPTDYGKYIANLRAAGCPEATVKDIVRGDTARAFAIKRAELGLSAAGNGPWSLRQENILVARLLHDSSQTAKLQSMPGTSGAATEFATAAPYTLEPKYLEASTTQQENSETNTAVSPQSTDQNILSVDAHVLGNRKLLGRNITPASAALPQYPLVLQNVNWNQLNLTPEQQTAVQQLQQQFIQNIGGPNQNPNDPAYLKRWRQAQPQSDLLFKAMLGVTAWENFQLMAADSGSQAKNPYSSSGAP